MVISVNKDLAVKLGLYEAMIVESIAESLTNNFTDDDSFHVIHKGIKYCNLSPDQCMSSLYKMAKKEDVLKAFKGLVYKRIVLLESIDDKMYVSVNIKKAFR